MELFIIFELLSKAPCPSPPSPPPFSSYPPKSILLTANEMRRIVAGALRQPALAESLAQAQPHSGTNGWLLEQAATAESSERRRAQFRNGLRRARRRANRPLRASRAARAGWARRCTRAAASRAHMNLRRV